MQTEVLVSLVLFILVGIIVSMDVAGLTLSKTEEFYRGEASPRAWAISNACWHAGLLGLYVLVISGFRSFGLSSARPLAAAISITAVEPSPVTPKEAVIFRPSGSRTRRFNMPPPVAAVIAETVPSPPSAIGIFSKPASRKTFLNPVSMQLAASKAVRRPLKESGAIAILIFFTFKHFPCAGFFLWLIAAEYARSAGNARQPQPS